MEPESALLTSVERIFRGEPVSPPRVAENALVRAPALLYKRGLHKCFSARASATRC